MTNNDFLYLLNLKKHFADNKIDLPCPGEKATKPFKVMSNTTRDIFFSRYRQKKYNNFDEAKNSGTTC